MARPRDLVPKLLVVLFSITALAPALYARASVDHFRWDVKTASDAEAQQVRRRVSATVSDLCALARPLHLTSYLPRMAPVEQTIYTIRAQFLFYRLEGDGDVHLVLQDPNDPSQTLIAEIPEPDEPGPFLQEISRLREAFDRRWSPKSSRKNGDQIMVEATGIGFFDKRHGAIGEAPNGIELHPLLDLKVIGP